MEPLTAVLTAVTTFLGLILGFLTLGARFADWLKATIVEVLVETGLIRHGENGPDWPNGWANLPDALHSIDDTQKWLVRQEEARRED